MALRSRTQWYCTVYGRFTGGRFRGLAYPDNPNLTLHVSANVTCHVCVSLMFAFAVCYNGYTCCVNYVLHMACCAVALAVQSTHYKTPTIYIFIYLVYTTCSIHQLIIIVVDINAGHDIVT